MYKTPRDCQKFLSVTPPAPSLFGGFPLTTIPRRGKMAVQLRAWWNWGAMGAPPVADKAT